jgi:hypothetical protein
MNAQRLLRHQDLLDGRLQSKRAGVRPALSWQTTSRNCVCNRIETRPGFGKGGDMENYFFFFFFFAMMKSSRFGPADQALEPLFENPRADHNFRIGDRRSIRNMFFQKIVYFSKT